MNKYIEKEDSFILNETKKNICLIPLIILFLLINSNLSLYGEKKQIQIKISDYLFSNILIEQQIIDSYNTNLKYLDKTSSRLPFIDDIQLRTSTDELNFNYQETSVKIIPKRFGIEKKEKELFDSYKNYYNTEKELVILNNLKNRYLNVIANIQNKNMFNLNNQLLKMYDELVEVKKVYINDFEVLDDIIKIEVAITKTNLKNIEIENLIDQSSKNINYELNDQNIKGKSFVNFNEKNFVNINYIKNLLTTKFENKYKFNKNNILFLKQRNLNDIELKGYNLDKKTISENLLSFIEFSYDNKYYYEEGKIDDAFSIGIGLSFSFLKNNDSFLKRKYVNILKEKNNYEMIKNNVLNEFSINLENLNKLIDQYLYLDDINKNSYAQFTLDTYTNNDQIDPTMLLEAKIKVFKNRILLNELKYDIMNNYIEILYISGSMYESYKDQKSLNTKLNFLEINN